MGEQRKVVAVLVSNPALGSILGMVLAAVPSLRVRPFESLLALNTYMRLAPVDLVVADFDSETEPADRVARTLRSDAAIERRSFQVIALASKVSRSTKDAAVAAGIDEVIVKPMSPKYLLERVLARLRRREIVERVLARLDRDSKVTRLPVPLPSNVIPLFPRLEPRV